MKKKTKFFLLLGLIASVAMSSGCSFPGFTSMDSMMHPPKATGTKAEIQEVIEENAGEDYVLDYPKSGNNRSAITMYDLDGDEIEEAVVFLTIKPDTTDATTHMYVIDEAEDEKWKIVGDFTNKNNDIDCLEFSDLNGDGLTDIIVGWNTYTVNQNNLYCYMNGKKEMKEINTGEIYTSLVTGNFIDNSKSEIMTMNLTTTDTPANGKLVTIDSDNSVSSMSVDMDADVGKFVSCSLGMLSTKEVGVFVDGITSSNDYNTQVLFYNQKTKRLENPIYKKANRGRLSTQRSTTTTCEDIDNDGIMEIPVVKKLPVLENLRNSNVSYETSWCNYDNNGNSAKTKSTVIINDNYGYSINIPNEWINNYTAYFNSDSSVLTFRQVVTDRKTKKQSLGKNMVTYISTLTKDWTNVGSKQGYTKIGDVGQYSYGYKIDKNIPYKFTKENATNIFVPKEDSESIAISPTEASNLK